MTHHRIALIVIAAALILDAACGLAFAGFQHIPAWHGLYDALANAVTLGGDVSPATPGAYAVNAVECLLIVPLFAAVFSLFTSGLTAQHVRKSESRIRAHITAERQQQGGAGGERPQRPEPEETS